MSVDQDPDVVKGVPPNLSLQRGGWLPDAALERYGSRFLAVAKALAHIGNIVPGFVNKVPRVKFQRFHHIGSPRISDELMHSWGLGCSDFDGHNAVGRLPREPGEDDPVDATPLFLVASGRIGVIDVDDMKMLPTVLDVLPDSPLWVSTGRDGGGVHIYFRTPEKVQSRNHILPGVDLKAHGAYVVAPGALHASGIEYTCTLRYEDLSAGGWWGSLPILTQEMRSDLVALGQALKGQRSRSRGAMKRTRTEAGPHPLEGAELKAGEIPAEMTQRYGSEGELTIEPTPQIETFWRVVDKNVGDAVFREGAREAVRQVYGLAWDYLANPETDCRDSDIPEWIHLAVRLSPWMKKAVPAWHIEALRHHFPRFWSGLESEPGYMWDPLLDTSAPTAGPCDFLTHALSLKNENRSDLDWLRKKQPKSAAIAGPPEARINYSVAGDPSECGIADRVRSRVRSAGEECSIRGGLIVAGMGTGKGEVVQDYIDRCEASGLTYRVVVPSRALSYEAAARFSLRHYADSANTAQATTLQSALKAQEEFDRWIVDEMRDLLSQIFSLSGSKGRDQLDELCKFAARGALLATCADMTERASKAFCEVVKHYCRDRQIPEVDFPVRFVEGHVLRKTVERLTLDEIDEALLECTGKSQVLCASVRGAETVVQLLLAAGKNVYPNIVGGDRSRKPCRNLDEVFTMYDVVVGTSAMAVGVNINTPLDLQAVYYDHNGTTPRTIRQGIGRGRKCENVKIYVPGWGAGPNRSRARPTRIRTVKRMLTEHHKVGRALAGHTYENGLYHNDAALSLWAILEAEDNQGKNDPVGELQRMFDAVRWEHELGYPGENEPSAARKIAKGEAVDEDVQNIRTARKMNEPEYVAVQNAVEPTDTQIYAKRRYEIETFHGEEIGASNQAEEAGRRQELTTADRRGRLRERITRSQIAQAVQRHGTDVCLLDIAVRGKGTYDKETDRWVQRATTQRTTWRATQVWLAAFLFEQLTKEKPGTVVTLPLNWDVDLALLLESEAAVLRVAGESWTLRSLAQAMHPKRYIPRNSQQVKNWALGVFRSCAHIPQPIRRRGVPGDPDRRWREYTIEWFEEKPGCTQAELDEEIRVSKLQIAEVEGEPLDAVRDVWDRV